MCASAGSLHAKAAGGHAELQIEAAAQPEPAGLFIGQGQLDCGLSAGGGVVGVLAGGGVTAGGGVVGGA